MKMVKGIFPTEKSSALSRIQGERANLPVDHGRVPPAPIIQIPLLSTGSEIFVDNVYPVSEFSFILECT